MSQTNFGGVIAVEPTVGIGYGTGAGGTVTQSGSKQAGVTLNKVTGQITMNNASMASSSSVGFILTNSTIAATDVVNVSIASGATTGAYVGFVDSTTNGACTIVLKNNSFGALAEAVVLNFAVMKGVTS